MVSDLTILNMVPEILSRQGCTVLQASTPTEASHLTKQNVGEIQLLVTDVIMPEMNGKDLSLTMKACNPGIKCLYMSGYPADVISHSRRAGRWSEFHPETVFAQRLGYQGARDIGRLMPAHPRSKPRYLQYGTDTATESATMGIWSNASFRVSSWWNSLLPVDFHTFR